MSQEAVERSGGVNQEIAAQCRLQANLLSFAQRVLKRF
jgi:hypothetical protein